MTIRDFIKTEIDMLPEDIIYAVRDFILFQKYHNVFEMDDTTYLSMIPGMMDSIQDGIKTPLSECASISEVWPDV